MVYSKSEGRETMNTITPVIAVRIVTHPSRLLQAVALQDALRREKFAEVAVILDKDSEGARETHLRAITAPVEDPEVTHILIIEDDAKPVPHFRQKLTTYLEKSPNDLISVYLGTSKPAGWQRRVDAMLTGEEVEGNTLVLSALIHGVAYSLPVHAQKIYSANSDTPPLEQADYHVGQIWFNATQRPIIYTVFSLVQHDDGGKSINTPNTYVLRVARQLDVRTYNKDGELS